MKAAMKTRSLKLTKDELHNFLEEKYDQYNRFSFIETDPISIPHQFTKKEDIEIAGFLAATIAWGQRVTIINNSNKLMKLMNNSPHDYVMNYTSKDLKRLSAFVHRTFNGIDCAYFIQALKHIYTKYEGLEGVFNKAAIRLTTKGKNCKISCDDVKNSISNFKKLFFEIPHPLRTTKHISDPAIGSSAKRLNMFLRWMVRKDKRGVDFGVWSPHPGPLQKRRDRNSENIAQVNIPSINGTNSRRKIISADNTETDQSYFFQKKESLTAAQLCCPLDVHTGNVARKLGLLKRTQNDWRAVEELTERLRMFDAIDPVKYDFALFGLGAFEGF